MGLKTKLTMAAITSAAGAAMIAGGTFALFSNTAANSGNAFTAGTVKIQDYTGRPVARLTQYYSNLAPGDSETKNVTIENTGSLDAYIRVDVAATKASESGPLFSGTTPLKLSFGTGGSNKWVYVGHGKTVTFPVTYLFPLAAGNSYQGKGGSVNVVFDAVQARNNNVSSNPAFGDIATVSTLQQLTDALANSTIHTIYLDANITGSVKVTRSVTIDGNGNTISVDKSHMPSGTDNAVIDVTGGTLTLNNVNVNGNDVGGPGLYGVKFYNASGSLNNVTVKGISSTPLGGAQEFRAIDTVSDNAAGGYTLSVTNSTVTDYQKSGIYVEGAGMTATITGNTITGDGNAASGAIAQNGITIYKGAVGIVKNNTVTDNNAVTNGYDSEDILFYKAGKGSVQSGNNASATFYDYH